MQHFEDALIQLKWSKVAGSHQCYKKRGSDGGLILLSCYVDDIVIAGRQARQELDRIRRVVTTTDPEPVSRLLGTTYTALYDAESNGTKLTVGMTEYARDTVERFEAHEGVPKLRSDVSAPFRPDKPSDATDPELQAEGIFAKQAPSYVMSLLWLGRQCRPDLMSTITTLAKRFTCWRRIDDLRLIHLMSFLKSTCDLVLHAWIARGVS